MWLKRTVYPGKFLLNSLELADTKVPKILPTRTAAQTSTSIDLISIDPRFQCLDYRVNQNAASDHSPVVANIIATPGGKLQPVIKLSFNKVDYEILHRRVANIDIPMDDSSADDKLNHWHQQMIRILDDVAPIKQYPWRKNKLPCLNQDMMNFIRSMSRHGTHTQKY